MAIAFGKYQLLRKIGSGGMGEVFLAREQGAQGFEKRVVIKRLLAHLTEDENFLRMFFDEARIAAGLNHPNLIQIFELGEASGMPFLAMEYVPGEDLRRLERFAQKAEKPLPLAVICRIVADAAAGLDHAHKATDPSGKPLRLVHRDVSPQNILVGFDGAVKLIDFGVAKATGRLQESTTGALKGKYPYMSPEQVAGGPLDARSDLFALGVIFWELVTGSRLFKADSDVATLRKVAACEVTPPSEISSSGSPALDGLILRALTKSPDERYPDAGALRMAIEDFAFEQRLPASTAHLTTFMRGLYADRIASDSRPESLDQLRATSADLDARAEPDVLTPFRGRRLRTATLRTDTRQRLGWAGSLAGAAILTGSAIVWWSSARHVARVESVSTRAPDPVVEQLGAASVQPEEPIRLRLASEPSGAHVAVDGKPLGVTPLEVPFPSHQATVVAQFSASGFEPYTATLSSSDGPVVEVRLRKKPGHRSPVPLGIKTGR